MRSRRASPDSTIAELVHVDRVTFGLKTTPFKREFLFEFRSRIPKEARKWVPEIGIWVVHKSYIEDVVRLAGGYFDSVDLDPKLKEVVQSNPFEALIRLAPYEAVKTLWREAVKKNHPDSGGTHENLLTLQDTWEKVQLLLKP